MHGTSPVSDARRGCPRIWERGKRRAIGSVDQQSLSHPYLAEHIMAMPAVERRWTAREVRHLISESPLASPRYELVDGELLVTPSPNRAHQLAVKALVRVLDDYVEGTATGRVLHSPFDVELGPDSVTQQGVFVV